MAGTIKRKNKPMYCSAVVDGRKKFIGFVSAQWMHQLKEKANEVDFTFKNNAKLYGNMFIIKVPEE